MLRFASAVVLVAYAAAAPLKKEVKVPGWPSLPFPFSEGVLHCMSCSPGSAVNQPCTLKISGNQGFDFMAKPPGLVPGGIANQTKYALQDISAIVTAANATMDDITSCTVWLADIADFEGMNSARVGAAALPGSDSDGAAATCCAGVYTTFFASPYPSRAAAGGYSLAGHGALVEIACEAIAPCPYS
jgi:enamine deaminase RidA (YjgF/YER057c/UK114 family)